MVRGNRASLNGRNFSSVGPISESLERGLSDDVLKIKSIFFGLFLTKSWARKYRKLWPVPNFGFI